MLERILARADGVPLFVEEFTRAVLEAGWLRDDGERHDLAGRSPPLAVPATLRNALVARRELHCDAADR